MAEGEVREAETKGKESEKKGLKGKWHGIPKPVLLLGGGVALFLVYRWYANRNSSSSTAAATPTTGGTQTSPGNGGFPYSYGGGGGYSGGGGGGTGSGSGGSGSGSGGGTGLGYNPGGPNLPPYPSPPGVPVKTYLGSKAFKVGGKTFSSVNSFLYKGDTYLGIKNPAEAKQLEAAGVQLAHNPTKPGGKGLFAIIPAGKTVVETRPAKSIRHQTGPTATGSKDALSGFTGHGSTQASHPATAKRPTPARRTHPAPKGQIAVHTGTAK